MTVVAIVLPRPLLGIIRDLAAAAYPRECCGLLIGRDTGTEIAISRLAESANVARGDGHDRFEVDPQVRFDVMRELGMIDAGGAADLAPTAERIVGHYHSHPNHPARPSETDLAMAFEPEMVWLITAVADGRPARTTAHRLDPAAGRFREIPITTPAQ